MVCRRRFDSGHPDYQGAARPGGVVRLARSGTIITRRGGAFGARAAQQFEGGHGCRRHRK
jgi:hypothetical protein